MRIPARTWTGAAALALIAAGAALAATPSKFNPQRPTPNAEAFEREVRPLLVAECQSCHGAKQQQGELRLTDRAGLLKGGSKGPALVPGQPDRSLLIQAVRHQGGLAMPPGKQLPPTQVAALERWVREGAPWPESGPKAIVLGDQTRIFQEAKTHWAYQPVRLPAQPKVKNASWIRNPVDAFVLARLEKAGLTPAPAADRRTLIRRVTYDLIGLPATPEEVEAFVADPAPDAYEKLVDRLLASPAYGERWGRHWLDVARYADTKDGVLMYGDSRIRPYAYTYRDYVIRAINDDTPYDEFLKEQLAADQMKVEPWRLAAMGFLTLGRQFDNNIHDIIDDRIDTVGRGMLGLTLACARCHDHKYDAVPTADYYSLYGVFASSEMPIDLPQIGEMDPAKAGDFPKKFAEKRQQVETMVDQQYTMLSETARQRVGDYVVHAATTAPDPLETAIFFVSLSPEDLRPQIVARWRRLLERRAVATDPVFGPWKELMDLPAGEMASRSAEMLTRWKARKPGEVNPLVLEALAKAKLTDRGSVAKAYGDLLKATYDASKQPNAPAPTPEAKQLLDLVTSTDSPCWFPKIHTYYYMNRAEKDAYGGIRNDLDVLAVQNAGAPPRAMVLLDTPELYNPRIFVRGNAAAPGENVPRQFLKVLSAPDRKPFEHGSGRLDLANAIADPKNPLTARVFVNRVWMHHFGEPLVATPGDFGSRSAPPTNPELLDYLAYRFGSRGPDGMGWSLKKLNRLLVTSAAYRQASKWAGPNPKSAVRNPKSVDPENKLLWRFRRQRLDFEEMRDTLLTLSGRLDRTMYGRPVRESMATDSRRRTVYCLVDRQDLPEVFRAFNFAQPDQSVDRRPSTTVPQQALFGLNSPFVVEQSKALAARPEVTGAGTDEGKISALYRLTLARKPAADELAAGVAFVHTAAASDSKLDVWAQYAQVLLQTNELVFVD